MTFAPLLLPMVWVVEFDSCGTSPKSTEITGLELISKFDLEAWAIVAPVLLISLATPFIAMPLQRAGQRLMVHVVGLLASGFAVYAVVMVLTFTLFSERMFRAAGAAVAATFIGAFGDAVWRLIWSVVEWRAERHGPPPAGEA